MLTIRYLHDGSPESAHLFRTLIDELRRWEYTIVPSADGDRYTVFAAPAAPGANPLGHHLRTLLAEVAALAGYTYVQLSEDRERGIYQISAHRVRWRG